LPAYSEDSIILSRIFWGSTDALPFEVSIEEQLQHCGKWPKPRSVLVMDNASFHHSDRIEQLCLDAGVKLIYLTPYLPELNPIEGFFSELKSFIRRHWGYYQDNPEQGFHIFLEWCVERVAQNTMGHFRNAGVHVDEQ
jgi:hypothetical protein